jgi:hypothetical protein
MSYQLTEGLDKLVHSAKHLYGKFVGENRNKAFSNVKIIKTYNKILRDALHGAKGYYFFLDYQKALIVLF